MLLMRADELSDWAERAKPGETVTYARGSITGEFAAKTRPLVDEGVIIPLFRRDSGEGIYLAKRGEGRMARVKRRQQQLRKNRGRFVRKTVRRSSEGMILRMLRHAVQRGKPCPTNKELARACNLSGDKSASYRMRRLVNSGRISVEDHSPYRRRVVTILTGKFAGMKTAEGPL